MRAFLLARSYFSLQTKEINYGEVGASVSVSSACVITACVSFGAESISAETVSTAAAPLSVSSSAWASVPPSCVVVRVDNVFDILDFIRASADFSDSVNGIGISLSTSSFSRDANTGS